MCIKYTECPANYENFVRASGSCLLSELTFGTYSARRLYITFSMWIIVYVTRWLLCDRLVCCSAAIFLLQCGCSLRIFYIIVCGKNISVVVDTLNGGKSGLLTVLYMFYSVINPLICYQWKWRIQGKVVQTCFATVNSCLAVLGFKGCRRLGKPKPTPALRRKGLACTHKRKSWTKCVTFAHSSEIHSMYMRS